MAPQVKLILCGSQVGTMKHILASRASLHGRARPLQIHPFPFQRAKEFLASRPALDLIERYAIAGGTPRYLNFLNRPGH